MHDSATAGGDSSSTGSTPRDEVEPDGSEEGEEVEKGEAEEAKGGGPPPGGFAYSGGKGPQVGEGSEGEADAGRWKRRKELIKALE